MGQVRFARGLSATFLNDLETGFLQGLIHTATEKHLDVQIRENCIDVYALGRSVLNLKQMAQFGAYGCKIHSKFLTGLEWMASLNIRSDGYCYFGVDSANLAMFIRSIDRIVGNAEATAEPEASAEQGLIQESHQPGSPLIFIDRQVQLHGVRKRLDLIGMCVQSEAKIVLTELKCGLNNDIQHVMDQIGPYYRLIAEDGRLREDVFASYEDVVRQKQRLGLLSPQVRMPEERPRVECLVVLYDYNIRSRLLDRLRQAAELSNLPASFVSLPKEHYVIPPISDWTPLCCAS